MISRLSLALRWRRQKFLEITKATAASLSLAGRHEYFLYIMSGTEWLSNAALAVPAMVLLHPKEVPL